MPTDFVKNLDKFRIGGKTLRGSEVTDHPREKLMRESGIFNDPHVTEEDKSEFFDETSEADQDETDLNSERRSNIMNRFTEDRSARGIIERKDNKDMAFEAMNNSLRSKGKPEMTREEFDSGFTKRDTREGLQFVSRGKIRPPKPTLTDRIRSVEAESGFMGMVNTKSLFTVGEKGKKEHVKTKKEFAKNNFTGIVKKRTSFMVAEDGAEFVEVIPLQNKHRPVMDLGLNFGYKLGKNTRKQKVVDFDLFNGKKTKQSTRSNKTDFDFFSVF